MSGSALLGGLSFAIATVLIVSALGKLTALDATARTFTELGLRRRPRVCAIGLVCYEWLVGIVYVAAPRMWLSAGLIDGLFVVFAATAVYALSSRKRVECNCFGAGKSRNLGAPQLAQLPVILAITTFGAIAGPRRSFDAAATLVIAAHLLVATTFVLAGLATAMRIRRHRLSLAEPGPTWRVNA